MSTTTLTKTTIANLKVKDNPSLTLDNSFIEGLQRVINAAGLEKNLKGWPHFLLINCQIGNGKIELQATDRFRVHTCTCDVVNNNLVGLNGFQLTTEIAKLIIKLKPNEIKIERLQSMYCITFDAYAFQIRANKAWAQINVHKIIPQSFRACFDINKKEFVSALRDAKAVAKKTNPLNFQGTLTYCANIHAIRVDVVDSGNKVFTRAIPINTERHTYSDRESIEKYMDNYWQVFNLVYLLDGAKVIREETITFCTNPSKPICMFNTSEFEQFGPGKEKTQTILISGSR